MSRKPCLTKIHLNPWLKPEIANEGCFKILFLEIFFTQTFYGNRCKYLRKTLKIKLQSFEEIFLQTPLRCIFILANLPKPSLHWLQINARYSFKTLQFTLQSDGLNTRIVLLTLRASGSSFSLGTFSKGINPRNFSNAN